MSDEDRKSAWSADEHPRYPPAPEWDLWRTEGLPKEDELGFQQFICRSLESSNSTSPGGVEPHETKDQYATWEDAPNSKCYASFGDNGTTASVGAYGHLMQISQYLGAGRSGMFALVSRVTDEPRWPLTRAQDLQEMSHNRSATSRHDDNHISVGLELRIRGLRSRRRQPQLKWLHWRWPRFEYDLLKSKLKVSIQWMVRDHVVLQQWLVENQGDDDIPVPIKLGKDMWIQDMEYLDYSNNFNDKGGAQGQHGSPGPHGYGWLLMHPFDEPMCRADPIGFPTLQSPGKSEEERKPPWPVQSSRERTSKIEEKASDSDRKAVTTNEPTQLEKERPIATAVMGVFVDGKARQFKRKESNVEQWEETLKKGTTMEVTAAYKLILVPKEAVDYRNFLIPVSAANVTQFLAEETSISSCSLSAINLGGKHVGPSSDQREDNGHLAPASPTLRPTDAIGNEGTRLSGTANLGSHEKQQRMLRPSGLPTAVSLRSHIDFAIWRNLEHILSVCAIPLKPPLLVEHQNKTTTGLGAENDRDAVALTCGDFSGHRLYNPASFFAFEFLIDIAQRLEQIKSSDSHLHLQKVRIKQVCKGHIIWLLSKAEVSQQTSCLRGDYFVTGRAVPLVDGLDEWDSEDSFVLKDTVTDNPFHIIKASRFIETYTEGSEVGLAFLKSICFPWVSMLNKADKRGKFAWAHRNTIGHETKLFRLDDHVWVWRALKSLQERGIWNEAEWNNSRTKDCSARADDQDEELEEDDEDDGSETSEDKAMPQSDTKMVKLIKAYAPSEVQRQVLQRFTILENDVTQRRMLAVTRSTERTRFLFHARDTALFYGAQWGFFSASGKGLWENTIDAQRLHSEDDAGQWDNAIRFGLGLIMGTRGLKFGGLDPEELIQRGIDVLFRSTSPSGLFPGQLDETNQQPTLFYRDRFRDFYFHAGFEIPFILLRFSNRVCHFYESRALDLPSILITVPENPPQNPDMARSQIETGPTASKPIEQRREAMGPGPTQQKTSLKKLVPFGSGTRVDQRSIVELSDEWLYNYPPFLDHDSTDFAKAVKIMSDHHQALEPSTPFEAVLRKALHGLEDVTFGMFYVGRTAIVDVRPKKQRRRSGDKSSWSYGRLIDNVNLHRFLERSEPRTAESAKKRFVWIPEAGVLTVLFCYIYTPDVRKEPLYLFFNRHLNYDNYFNDDPTRISNSWETEMHLSFYMLTSSDLPKTNGWSIHASTKAGYTDFPSGPTRDKTVGSQVAATAGKKIFRSSFGLLFDGDFFDRYWTCYFIEDVPKPESGWTLPFGDESKRFKGNSWHQRKVLELILCDHILDLMLKGSGDILEEARQVLHVKAGFLAYTVENNDEFKKRSDLWEAIQPILRTVHDELSTAFSTLSKWATREKDREAEAPRWTRNDERKYRGVLNKLEGSTSRKINDVERILGRIDALEKFLDSYFDKTRARLSNENMLTFTYVTVIFLPLGFAASIFSMAEAPGRVLVTQMIVCAVITLFLTVVVLMNAKILLGTLNRQLNASKQILNTSKQTIKDLGEDLDRRSRSKMQQSQIFQSYSERYASKSLDASQPESSERLVGSRSNAKEADKDAIKPEETAIHWLFWPAVLLAEQPARLVLKAFRAPYEKKPLWKAISHIALGLIILPLFILSWTLQTLCFNAVDLMRLAIFTTSRMRFSRPSGSDGKKTEENKPSLPDEDGNKDEDGKQAEDGKKDEDGEQGGGKAVRKERILMNLTYPLISSRPFRKLLKDKEQQETRSSSHSIAED